MGRIRRFIQESVAELRKVSWPTLEQTRNLTVLVFTVSFLVGAFVLFWDQLFQFVIGILSKSVA
ncbi:MAG TPA: preprotein translocase subunit SecE [Candidatus Limnocylindrales bacterium]|nr:preprotein translocase subunit SecE [Candidatus Limnocylindrales bacterium]